MPKIKSALALLPLLFVLSIQVGQMYDYVMLSQAYDTDFLIVLSQKGMVIKIMFNRLRYKIKTLI
ncbi:hypothetical protein TW85_16375 [Marinomonas sp. S3726]|nr:hypothetical protein TW85_16375 [Marinomonas sp. S3726]